jgi:exodeoxyribonuclease VIII
VDGKPVQGIYFGISMPEYESIPALNWSRLSGYLKSAAHGKAAEAALDESDELTIGSAVHRAVLEPEKFDEEFGAVPDDAPAKRSNADKEWWRQFYAANQGKTFLKPETLRDVKRMAEVCYAHPRAGKLLTAPGNKREVVIVWMHPTFGLWCKARIDLVTRLGGISYVADLKTSRDASPYGFARDISLFNYHAQLAHYRDGLNIVAPFERSVCFIVVEKDPIIPVVYDLDEASLEQGARDVARAFQTYIDAEAAQSWPGYEDGMIGLPAWRLKGGE